MYLIVVDTMQIQPYIFGSNRLRENLGASYLVAQATEEWAWKHLPEPNNRGPNYSFTAEHIEVNTSLKAEAIYAGGGNFVALIREPDEANKFVRGLSRQVLEDAPGLQLLIDCHDFQWQQSLVQAIRDAFKRLGEQKRNRAQTAPLLGLGVTVPCQGTGLPAVEWVKPTDEPDEVGYPASAEICEKLRAVRPANDKLENIFHDLLLPKHLEFPYDLDHMGRSEGEFSHIAIIHADSDGMSQLFSGIGDKFAQAKDNCPYIDEVRRLSQLVKANGREALERVLAKLVDRLEWKKDIGYFIIHRDSEGKRELAKIALRRNDESKNWWLPFRPIVYGGDDVTFVCDGRLGLALAADYLQELENINLNLKEFKPDDPEWRATACAGIAITKTHYPFARGYELAEQLCQSAKEYRAVNKLANTCAMDWHFALSGLAGDLDEIRKREYKTRDGWLHLRPVSLTSQDTPPLQTWQATVKFTSDFQGKDWMTRRNKVKALRDALRQGENAVKRFRTLYSEKDKPINLPDGFAAHPKQENSDKEIRETGWTRLKSESPEKTEKHAIYFDALELADWYVPLENKP